jgi:SNF2 family DNA or RNA helicase
MQSLYILARILNVIDICCRLDLTAASRVHLLEPQWNPSLEDQALARVHRLGQTRPVITIRYIMEDSFEEVSNSISNK